MEYTQACNSRLSCGLCLITNQPCPFTIQYHNITCQQPHPSIDMNVVDQISNTTNITTVQQKGKANGKNL